MNRKKILREKMANYNCCNCGAPYETTEYRCPYCGTLYLDLSMIDFDKQEPFFLTIKKNNQLITQKVLPQTATFENTVESVDCYNTKGQKLLNFLTNNRLETNIQFIAIPFDDNNNRTMCQVVYNIDKK